MYPSGSCHGLLAKVFGVLPFVPSTRKIRYVLKVLFLTNWGVGNNGSSLSRLRGAQGTACLAVRPRVGTGCPVGAAAHNAPSCGNANVRPVAATDPPRCRLVRPGPIIPCA
jgi:hypothetical protein